MSVVNEKVTSRLQQIFGDRMKVDLIERKLYSYDVGALPSLIKPFVPVGIAGAVVRPMEEAEIVQLVRLAEQEKLQLVPRGSSTSGYGGVLPAKGAVVVDLSGMDKVIAVDSAQKIVRVQSGIIWEQLQKQINKKGLDLRLYPTSLPASTVGGWLAQGGSGFGSYEYGEFKENVLAARVVMPSGELRNFSGQELAGYIADAEGITGIITEVTLSVRDLMPEVHQAFAFKDSKSLGDALKAISQKKLPIWSITFLNPESLRLKKKLPHKHGHPYEEANPHVAPVLPEAYVMIIVYPESRRSAIDTALAGIIKANKGEELSSEAAEHEWDLRFAPMRLKRIGPSIITTEVIVPTEKLTDVLNEIAKKIKQPFMPKTMDSLMPNLLPLLVPHITPMMIEYIKTGRVPSAAFSVAETAATKNKKNSAKSISIVSRQNQGIRACTNGFGEGCGDVSVHLGETVSGVQTLCQHLPGSSDFNACTSRCRRPYSVHGM